MKVAITGALGFVGRHMVPFFLRRGAQVVGIDSKPRDEAAPPGCAFVECDVRRAEEVRAAVAGCDVLVHMASAHLQVGLPERTYWSVNVESLPRLLEAARDAGVRHFVHTSSVGVHGSLVRVPGDETSDLKPENVYERTKAAGEAEVRKFANGGPMGITIVRPAWIYGPADERTTKILRSIRKGTFVLFGKGLNYRHPIYVDDYLEAVGRMLLEPRTYGKTYILAGPRFMRVRELLTVAESVTGGRIRFRVPLVVGYVAGLAAEALTRPVGAAPPISRRTLAFFRNDNAFDTTRARLDFGFDPRVDLAEGLSSIWRGLQASR